LVEETGENHWPVTNMEKADVCPQKNTFTCNYKPDVCPQKNTFTCNYKHDSFTLPYFCVFQTRTWISIGKCYGIFVFNDLRDNELWCLMPLSTIFQFYWWRKRRESHRPAARHWQTLSHMLYQVHLIWVGFELTTLVHWFELRLVVGIVDVGGITVCFFNKNVDIE
jgi:hypothetical protein